MRLEKTEIESIKKVILGFEPSATIYLYGSRIDDAKQGGDIDLMMVAQKKISLMEKIRMKLALYDTLGEQKIDLLIADENADSAFINMVKQEGKIL